MTSDRKPDATDAAFWREFLTQGDPRERAKRRLFKLIPTEPRCRICAAPFAGIGAPIMRVMGKRPSDMNPNWCMTCFTLLSRHHGGAEIELTMLFADIRGSTTLAESMPTAAFTPSSIASTAWPRRWSSRMTAGSTSSWATRWWPCSFRC